MGKLQFPIQKYKIIVIIKSQIVEIVETIAHQEYIKTFITWLEKMRLCVENKGDYFEHLKNEI